MLFTPLILAVAIPAVVFAGISKGGFGSVAAFAGASILALVLDPLLALGLMLPVLVVIDLAGVQAFWRKWDWPTARLLMVGSVPGIALGALFFARADADAIRLLVGGVSLAFVAWQGAIHLRLVTLRVRKSGPVTGLLAGVALAFTSFVSHAGGPVAAVYLLRQGMDKTTYQATTVVLFWFVNMAKALIYAGTGVFTYDTLLLDLVLVPFALLGTWLGVKAHYYVPDKLFFAITYVALSVAGAKLVWDALT